MDRGFIYSFMAGCRYGVVSSVAADGTPQSALVGIAVTPDLEIVFDTVSSSRKYRNLKACPQCSIVMWTGEVTLQYEGIAEEVRDDRYKETYFKKMPGGRDRL